MQHIPCDHHWTLTEQCHKGNHKFDLSVEISLNYHIAELACRLKGCTQNREIQVVLLVVASIFLQAGLQIFFFKLSITDPQNPIQ